MCIHCICVHMAMSMLNHLNCVVCMKLEVCILYEYMQKKLVAQVESYNDMGTVQSAMACICAH